MSSIYQNISTLFNRSRDQLSDQELRDLGSLSDSAEEQAILLRNVLNGIGSLIASDGTPSERSESFQSLGHASDLLWTVAHSLDTIAAMVHVAGDAEFTLNERAESDAVETRRECGIRELQRIAPLTKCPSREVR